MYIISALSKRITIIIFVIFVGVLFRFFLASHAYPLIVFDAKTYVDFAGEFLRGSFPIDARAKNLGYPLFLAALFWLRGGVDVEFVKFVQVFLDIAAGIFIWIAAQKKFSQRQADLALFLYMINPFTSSYVGLLLPEALSCFLIAALLAISVTKNFSKNIFSWFLVGFLLGLLLFVRFSMLVFAFGSIGLTGLLYFKKRLRWEYLIVALFGFIIASSYTLIMNYKTFGTISFTPVHSTNAGQVYLSTFVAGRIAEVENSGIRTEAEVSRIYSEYANTPVSQIPQWNKRYSELFFSRLKSEPFTFLSHYISNMFWLWDKDHLFTYLDPWFPKDRYILRIVNLTLLGLGILGIGRYLKRGLTRLSEPFMIITLVLAVVMTFEFPLVSGESRHTIPFYPLLFFWAAYGMGTIGRV